MYKINIARSGHDFDKLNLVSIHGKFGLYDIVKCKKCGVKGKRYDFQNVLINESVNEDKAIFCNKREIKLKIKIILCHAVGDFFKNLTPNSIHNVIDTPSNEKKDGSGVWVMGNGVPVKVINGEFEYVD